MQNKLTKCELYEILEIIHELTIIESNEQIMGVARSVTELIEYDFIIFGLPGPSFEKTQSVVDLNINYPQDWVDLYQENNFCHIDPVVLATKQKCAPQHWVDIYSRFPPDTHFEGLAHDFGLKDGWSCLTRGILGLPWTIISVGGGYKKYKNNKTREESIIARLAPHFHIALSSLKAKNETNKVQKILTPREQEVLKWLSKGKTSWELSIILNVAEATINFHLKNINAKLNTVNRSQAVAVAIHSGLSLF
jgi:DNA-binding CsgD family transcriptional regulator